MRRRDPALHDGEAQPFFAQAGRAGTTTGSPFPTRHRTPRQPATRALLEDALGLVDRYCAATRMDAVRFRL
ncbi:hypothetical protein, partial [Acetobacter malorum]|uniref:hypothetical protein n=1 Tax=Acetobacter malorum TaxID=178901 RepID=UPI0012E8885A